MVSREGFARELGRHAMNHIRQTRIRATRHARFYGVTRAQVVTSACWGVLLLAWGVQAAVEALLA
jgi:hypothetical protein